MSELSPQTQALLEAAREADNPAPADRDRMRGRLAVALGSAALAGTTATTTVSAATAGAAGATAAASSAAAGTGAAAATATATTATVAGSGVLATVVKLTVTAAVVGAVGVGVVVQRDAAPPAAAPVAAAQQDASKRVTDPVVVVQAPAAPVEMQADVEPEPVVVASETPRVQPAPAAKPTRSAPAHRRTGLARAPRPSAPVVTAPTSAGPVPSSGRAAVAAPIPASSSLAAPKPAPRVQASLQLEVGMLERGQRALRDGSPQAALAVVREHARRFPQGLLRQERLGLEALARCAAGEDGARVLARFLRRAPGSPLTPRVREACAVSPRTDDF